MESLMERDPYDDMGPDSTRELIDLGWVEVAPNYRVEISVPFTSEQMEAVSKIMRERGASHSEVVQDLVAEALAARRTSQ